MDHDLRNIMVILSSPSGAGKTTITKKFNKNTTLLSFQFRTQRASLDQMKLMVLIIFLLQRQILNNSLRKKVLRICKNF